MDQIYTISEINKYIKDIFVKDYVLNRIYLKGEVSNCKYHSSGHIYFTLKDETGQMACVMFAGQRTGLSFRMQEGQDVIVLGSINVYERDGRYQMYAKEIRLDGIGILYERFEHLKQKLYNEGLFDPTHKKPIPKMAKTIGIVTSSTGAVIKDIMNVTKRRNPYIQLVLYPAKVQGEDAAKSIVKGIKKLDSMSLDIIIIGRGGGSIEDLWAFNEEITVRAIYECQTPIISAVGHETDFTLSDYAADLRASTPSAAAELASGEMGFILSTLVDYHSTLTRSMLRKIENYKERLDIKKLKLGYVSPVNQLRQKRQLLIDTEDKMNMLLRRILDSKKHKFSIYVERLKGLSPIEKLNHGFSYVSGNDGKAVTSIKSVEIGDSLTIDVTDGRILVTTEAIQQTVTDFNANNQM